MTQWNVPYQESLGPLKQHRQTCTNTLLCLWRGKALVEIIGLLGSDISKCKLSVFPLYPHLWSLIQFPYPVPQRQQFSMIKSIPHSLSVFFSFSLCLSDKLCNDKSVELLSFWLCEAGAHWGHRAEQLWNHSAQIWHSCENKHGGTSVSFKKMRDCVDFDFYSLSFLKLYCRTLRRTDNGNKSWKQHFRKTNSGCSLAYYCYWNMTGAFEKYHLFYTNLSVPSQLLTVQLTLSRYQLHPPSILWGRKQGRLQ